MPRIMATAQRALAARGTIHSFTEIRAGD